MRHDAVLTMEQCIANESTIRSIAGGFGYTMTVHNSGHHMRFLSPFGAVDWWPSTGRWSARQVVQAGRIRSLADLKCGLKQAATLKGS